ncbi:MAG: hypothetical protein ACR2FZ_07190 [Thermoleophilaceae bacterium]
MTIIEVMVAMMLLLMGVLATVTMIDRATAANSDTKARDRGTSLARDLVEAARGIPYPNLLSTTIQAELKSRTGLEDANTGTPAYEVRRGGFEYTVTPSICTVDDAKDGLGDHTAGGFCPGAAGNTAGDAVPDDYRQVTIAVAWRADGRNKTMRQATTVNNPGSAFGPAVTAINPVGTSLPIYDELVSVDFDITTNLPSDTVRWSVDGVDQGVAAKKGGSDTTWSVAWLMATLLDGPYLITGQAYDTSGLSAGPITKPVVLNRFAPLPPIGVFAGRTGLLLDPNARVDIEWLANKERDIAGYQVFRVLGLTPNLSLDEEICSVSEKVTTCTDSPAPAGAALYYVVARDRDAQGQLRRGAPSVAAPVNLVNLPPTAVQNLSATTDGDVTLSWDPPSSAGEPTDTIEFYRVYRDGQAVGNRYARVGISSPPVTYTDRNAGGGHRYWVSAVDSQLAESPLVGGIPAP